MAKEPEAPEGARKSVIGGSVTALEYRVIDAAREQAGYKRMSHFVRDVMLTVSTSEPARTAVLAVVGRQDRRHKAA